MNTHSIAVVPGDGTGPEVVAEAVKVLEVASKRFRFQIELNNFDVGGDRYLRTGETLTQEDLEGLKRSDAILFGAVGHPDVKPGILEQEIIIALRRQLDQYINLRPIKLYPGVTSPLAHISPEDVDFVVVRENTEGLYVNEGSFSDRGTTSEVAEQRSRNTRFAVERCVRYAYDLAQKRPRRHLTLFGKTNVLTYAWDLWDRVFQEVGTEYPDVKTAYAHVDAACLWMVEDPGRFDVVVTDNMFGDIVTDLGAAIQGGLGIASGANVNPDGVSMFEPIGGTAPGFEGTGHINPLAAIGSAAMMLNVLGESEAGSLVEAATGQVAGSLPSLWAGKMGATTTEVGDQVAALVDSSDIKEEA